MAINLNEHGYANARTAIPGEFGKLPVGGYICTVADSEIIYSKAGNPMLRLFLEITEGEFKGYFNEATKRSQKFNPDKRWDSGGIFHQNIFNKDDKVSPFFKGLITVLMRDNPDTKINFDAFDPSCIFGAKIGFVFAEEEYDYNGHAGVRVVPKIPKAVADILDGNFKVPELKRKSGQEETRKRDYDDIGGETVELDDTPF